MKILFIITARGGSKGVPRKNISIIGNKPLIAYKIIAAQKCNFDKRIIVSTDDDEIASVAKRYGAEVPFIRPSELATDTASSLDVVDHAVNWIRENDDSKYDYICLLEPSSPFLTYDDINIAFEQIIDKNADTLLGMKEAEVSREFIHTLDGQGGLSLFYESIISMRSVRRQDQPKQYTMNGCIYIAKADYWEKNRSFHSMNSTPYIMPAERSIEIDSQLDFMMAKLVAEMGLVDVTLWD